MRSLVIATRFGDKTAAAESGEYGLENAKAIGQSIAPFYGQAAADKFTTEGLGVEADMWDPMMKHIYTLSDALAAGVAKQFPDKL